MKINGGSSAAYIFTSGIYGHYVCPVVFNCREAIAEAIIGLLLVFFSNTSIGFLEFFNRSAIVSDGD